MSAQLKLKPNEQAALDVMLANRRTDVFEIERAKAREGLVDEFQEAVYFFVDDILKNYQAGDDTENGRILGNALANFAMRIHSARMAQELREEFLPSWRNEP
jgi:hypothetical protein